MNDVTDRTTKVEDLPVTISLEMDRKQISIDELTRLASGNVMKFSDKAPDTVRVFANNQYFADATLIMIEDQVAVRIDRLA